MSNINDKYFGSLPVEEIGGEIMDRIRKYYEFVEQCGIFKVWNKSHEQYFSGYYTQGEILKRGQNNNLRKINVNHYGNILSHFVVITTKQKPVFEPRAINSDHKSMSQALLASDLCDYYMRVKGMDRQSVQAVNYCNRYGEGWVAVEWDFENGEVVGQNENGQPIKGGDIVCNSFTPDNVIRDICRVNDKNDWIILRRTMNKFDLAAKYGQYAEEIISAGDEIDVKNIIAIDDYRFRQDSDLITYYTFYHDKTPSMPEGRMVEMVNDDIIMFDGKLPYNAIPVYDMSVGMIDNLPFGYTIGFDLLPVQNACNMLYSTAVTNQNAFGVQNIVAQQGSNIEVSDLGGGLKLLSFAGDKEPKPLQLLSTAPEIFRFLRELIGDMEMLSGINSVSRGNTGALGANPSGSALALVQSLTIEFLSGQERAYARMLEKMGTQIVDLCKEFVSIERKIMITGKAKKSYIKSFTGEDLSEISLVQVDIGNPLSKTLAGNIEAAESLLRNNMIQTPEQYLQVRNTGKLEPLVESVTSQLMLIKEENEKLSEGEQVPVMATDDDVLHIKEHGIVGHSSSSRNDPNAMNALTLHLQAHIINAQQTDPMLKQMLGQQSLAPMPPPPGAMPPGGAPEGDKPKEEGPARMPTNPVSGEQYNPETGGL